MLPRPSKPADAPADDVEEAAPEAPAAADTGDAITEDVGGVPAHLLERSRKRKAALSGGGNGDAGAAAPAAAGGGAAGAAPRRGRGDCGRAGTGGNGSRRSHATTADSRQVRLDPADAQPKRRTRSTRGRTCSSIEFASTPVAHCARDDLLRDR